MTDKWQHTPLQWIPVKNLSVVWIKAQRPLNERWAQYICDNFDPELYDPLVVTSKDGNGMYHVVRGQHRKTAVQMKWGDEEQVPCFVMEITDPARAADLLVRSNTQVKPMAPVYRFKCSVTAKYPDQVAIHHICKATGYKVEQGCSDGMIAAVGALEWVYRKCGPAVLRSTLSIIRQTWGYDHSATNSGLLRAYGTLLTQHPHINTKRVTEVMDRMTPAKLQAQGKSEAEVHGSSITDGIVRIIIKLYNHGLTQKHRLQPK